MFRPRACLLVLLTARFSAAEILGPLFPAPTDLTSSTSLVKAAWTNLTSTLNAYLLDGRNTSSTADLSGTENVTWSTGLFSLHDAAASELQYHYTSPETASAGNGTNIVDGNSIYRVASVSKLITTFAGLLALTDNQWHMPLSELIPGLGPGGDGLDPLSAAQWDKITPWALANQQSGVATVGIPASDIIGIYIQAILGTNTSITTLETTHGLPPTEVDSLAPCTHVDSPSCFIASVKTLHANLLPWTTAAYSDFGFMLLGLAISNATGKSYDEMYHGAIFEPLGMASTFLDPPTVGAEFDRSVVVGSSPVEGGFILPGARITIPSGGVLSTANDLAKLGVGLLNSTLLTPEKTRKWMKPHGHTASLTYSIGAPWEIVRYIHPGSGKVTDMYTKLGDSGAYGAILVLIPEYDAGFSFLNGATDLNRTSVALSVINRIAETVVPVLEAQAIAEAKKNFVGEYACSDSPLNSSISITLNETTISGPTAPALSISRWISNGTDMLVPFFTGLKPQLQLTIPKRLEGPGPVAFEAFKDPQYTTYEQAKLGPFSGFYASNFGWAQVDQQRYAGNNVGLFVFEVDGEGRAESIRSAATGAVLRRMES